MTSKPAPALQMRNVRKVYSMGGNDVVALGAACQYGTVVINDCGNTRIGGTQHRASGFHSPHACHFKVLVGRQ